MIERSRSEMPDLLAGLSWASGPKLPVILQTEASECGLAALTMIAGYHGHDVDLPSLRRMFAPSLKGMTLQTVINIAAALGFQSRPARLELDELRHLATPCILHWDFNHFVVLKKVHASGATVHDPARGVRKVSNAELSKHFTGVALECTPRVDFQPVKAREAISLDAVVGKVDGLWPVLAKIFVLAVSLEVITLAWPFYLQWTLDQVLVSADKNLLIVLSVAFLIITVVQSGIAAGRSWMITWLSTSVNVTWVTNVFSHMLSLPLDWFEKRHIGDVMSRYESLNTIQRTMTGGFIAAILDGLMAVLTLAVLLSYSVKLTVLVLAAFVGYAIIRFVMYGRLRRAQEDQIYCAARQETELLESIRGAMTLKLHNQQQGRAIRYANAVVRTFNENIRIQRLNIAFSTTQQLIVGIEKVAVIGIGAGLSLSGVFTAGMLVAFVSYADQFMNRVGSFIDKAVEFRMMRLHARRLADIVLTEPENHVRTHWDGTISDTTIELRNVSFRYSISDPWVLRNCSLVIRAGESVALIGASGCGKTTLGKIILGLLEPEEGEVLCGGVDIRRIGLTRYRNLIGTVMQDDHLFTGSIAENIRGFSDEETNDMRIEGAAKLASIHDDITDMPMGYQTLIGDMGSALSGGQKQRLILARAIYRKPKVLLLDEATSHLDVAREREINCAVRGLRITSIVIAHRPETIASADRVILVADGVAHETPAASENPQRSACV